MARNKHISNAQDSERVNISSRMRLRVDQASPSHSHSHHNLINIVRLITDWLHTRSQMRLFINTRVDFLRKIFIRNMFLVKGPLTINSILV